MDLKRQVAVVTGVPRNRKGICLALAGAGPTWWSITARMKKRQRKWWPESKSSAGRQWPFRGMSRILTPRGS